MLQLIENRRKRIPAATWRNNIIAPGLCSSQCIVQTIYKTDVYWCYVHYGTVRYSGKNMRAEKAGLQPGFLVPGVRLQDEFRAGMAGSRPLQRVGDSVWKWQTVHTDRLAASKEEGGQTFCEYTFRLWYRAEFKSVNCKRSLLSATEWQIDRLYISICFITLVLRCGYYQIPFAEGSKRYILFGKSQEQ